MKVKELIELLKVAKFDVGYIEYDEYDRFDTHGAHVFEPNELKTIWINLPNSNEEYTSLKHDELEVKSWIVGLELTYEQSKQRKFSFENGIYIKVR